MTPETHLVLGGSGFIGRHVAGYLAKRGQMVIVADRVAPPPMPPAWNPHNVEFAQIDVGVKDWEGLVTRADVIHHYVWTTVPQTANDDPIADLNHNVGTTIWLLDAMRRLGGKRMVFTSSGGSVYGRLRTTPVSEDHPLNPISAYGASKVAAEKYIGFYRAQYGVDGRIARVANPFGAGQDPCRNQGAVATFLDRALKNEAISIWGDGSVVRDYIHIADTAAALARLADAPLSAPSRAPTFNVASGEGRSLNQIVGAIGALLGRPADVQYSPARPFDVPVNVLNITRAKAMVDWHPRLAFEQGLARMRDDIAAGQTYYSTLD